MSARHKSRYIVVVYIVVMLLSVVTWALEPEDTHEQPVAIDELKNGLMTALGDSFKYLSGEVGRAPTRMGGRSIERFWFAKVEAKRAGIFTVSYSVSYEFPVGVKKKGSLILKQVIYTIPITINERGMLRILTSPISTWDASTWPVANVGDTLIVPISISIDRQFLDPFRKGGYIFTATRKDDGTNKDKYRDEDYLKHISETPVIRNDATDQLHMLTSWGRSEALHANIEYKHELTAYLEFKQPGEFNLAARMADTDKNTAGDGVAIRVLKNDRPVTVSLNYAKYCEEYISKTISLGSIIIPSGTIEARVGDRVVLSCGQYKTLVKEGQKAYQLGVIFTQPFKAVEPYSPEISNKRK